MFSQFATLNPKKSTSTFCSQAWALDSASLPSLASMPSPSGLPASRSSPGSAPLSRSSRQGHSDTYIAARYSCDHVLLASKRTCRNNKWLGSGGRSVGFCSAGAAARACLPQRSVATLCQLPATGARAARALPASARCHAMHALSGLHHMAHAAAFALPFKVLFAVLLQDMHASPACITLHLLCLLSPCRYSLPCFWRPWGRSGRRSTSLTLQLARQPPR